MFNLQQMYSFGQIQTSQTGGQLSSDTSPYKVSECSLDEQINTLTTTELTLSRIPNNVLQVRGQNADHWSDVSLYRYLLNGHAHLLDDVVHHDEVDAAELGGSIMQTFFLSWKMATKVDDRQVQASIWSYLFRFDHDRYGWVTQSKQLLTLHFGVCKGAG